LETGYWARRVADLEIALEESKTWQEQHYLDIPFSVWYSIELGHKAKEIQIKDYMDRSRKEFEEA